ncbi:MAG: hypothetical protein PHU85_14405, partial [Phycisphaerae bacterium]|nr:hypothetical protein [Phycisphaerae bacterium]
NGVAATTTINTTTSTITGATGAAGAVSVTYGTIEHLVVNTAASTTLAFTGSSLYQVTPGAALDAGQVIAGTLPVDFLGLGSGETLSLTGTAGSDTITVNGTAVNDTISVAASSNVTLAGRAVIDPTSIESLAINGLAGDDQINVTGGHAYSGGVTVEGGGPSASDVLYLTGAAATVETVAVAPSGSNNTQQTVTGLTGGTLTVSGVETIRYTGAGADDTLTVALGAGDDTAVLQGGTFAGDVVESSSLPNVEFTGVATFVLDTVEGNDVVTVRPQYLVGATAANYQTTASSSARYTLVVDGVEGGSDSFTVTNPAGAPTVAVALGGRTVTAISAAGLNRLVIAGLGGDDSASINVDTATSDVIPVPITFDGGAGADTLIVGGSPTTAVDEVIQTIGANPGDGRLLYQSAADAALMIIDYANLEPVVDSVAATTLTVVGTNGNNAINYSEGTADTTGIVSVDGNEVIAFSNKTNLVLDGQAGDDTIHLNNPSTPDGLASITVNGGDPTASDTLIVNGTAATTTVATATTSITGAGPVAITYAAIEHLTVNAGASTTLAVTGSASYIVTPGVAADAGEVQTAAIPIAFVGLGSGETLSLAGVGGADSITLNGAAGNDIFTVAATTGNATVTGRATVAPTGIEALTLNGQDGDDTFTVTGPQSYTTINLVGGDPSGSDVATVAGDASAALTVTLGIATPTATGGGLGAINLSGIETVNASNGAAAINIDGGTGPDSFVVTPTGANTATVQANGASPVVNTTNTGALLIQAAGGGSNSLTVNATGAVDTIDADISAATINTGLKVVTYTAANIDAVTVNSLAGADAITVTPGAEPLFVDGGDPIGVLPGDQLTVVATGGTVTYAAGPETDQGGINVGANGTVSWDNIETVNVSGPSSVLVTGTNGDDDITVIARDDSTHSVLATATPGEQDFTVSVNQGQEVLFIDAPTLYIDALAGDDDINVRAPAPNGADWNVDLFVAGGVPGASDKLVFETPGVNTVAFTPTGADTGTILLDQPTNDSTFTLGAFTVGSYISSPGGIERVVYDARSTADTLTVNGAAVVNDTFVVTAGDTIGSGSVRVNAFLALDFTALSSGSTLTMAGNTGTDTLVYEAAATNDTFAVAATTGAVTLANQAGTHVVLTQSGVEALRLVGLAGDDTFTVNGGHPYSGGITVEGGDPSASDVLYLTGAAGATAETVAIAPSASNNTMQTITGLTGGTLTVSGVEVIRYTGADTDDTLTVGLGDGSNVARVEGAGLSVDRVVSDSLPVVEFTGLDGFTLAGGLGGADTLTFAIRALGGATAANYRVGTNTAGTVVIEGDGENDALTAVDALGGGFAVSDTFGHTVTGNTVPAQLVVNTLGGDDTLTVDVTAGFVVPPVTFDGGAGIDRLVVSGTPVSAVDELIQTVGANPGDGRLLYQDGANATLMTIDYANLEPVIDSVTATTLTVVGTNGNNAINYSEGTADTTGIVAVDGNETIEFSNKTNLVIDAQAGDDTIHLNNPSTPDGLASITVNGGDPTASDTLIVNATAATVTVAQSTRIITGAGPVSITYGTDIEDLTVVGGTAMTNLTITGSTGYEYTPAAATDGGTVLTDTIPVTFTGLGSGETLGLTGTAGSDTIIVNGTANNDTISVAASSNVTFAGRVVIDPTSIENLVINSLAGDDQINVTGGHAYSGGITVEGGDPSASDVLYLTGAAGATAETVAIA